MVANTMTIDEALETARRECNNQYAISYIDAISWSINEHGTRGFKIQLLYVLNNLQYWRGKTAREAKAVLKRYSK